ncbi:MAG: FecR family protein, partial [Deltaproteobacteria bacterium]|nr:FecR family protein [Deltaproteobacteria bacterium]
MKKKLFKITITVFFLLSVFSFCSWAYTAIGKVTAVVGSVDVLKPQSAQVTPVTRGDLVHIGDIYRTKSASYAEITFNNNSTLRIGERTRVEIKEYMVEKDRTNQVMKLHRGRIQAIATEEIVRKAKALVEGHRFEVHTPNAVAGIRGSNMMVGYSYGTTLVVFIKGRGYVYNPRLPHVVVPVSQGQISIVRGDTPPSPPSRAPENIIRGEGRTFLRIEREDTQRDRVLEEHGIVSELSFYEVSPYREFLREPFLVTGLQSVVDFENVYPIYPKESEYYTGLLPFSATPFRPTSGIFYEIEFRDTLNRGFIDSSLYVEVDGKKPYQSIDLFYRKANETHDLEAFSFPDGTKIRFDRGNLVEYEDEIEWTPGPDWGEYPPFTVYYSEYSDVRLLLKDTNSSITGFLDERVFFRDNIINLKISKNWNVNQYPFFFFTPLLKGAFHDPNLGRNFGNYVLSIGGYVAQNNTLLLSGLGLYIDHQNMGGILFSTAPYRAELLNGTTHTASVTLRAIPVKPITIGNSASSIQEKPLLVWIEGSVTDNSGRSFLRTPPSSGRTVFFSGQDWGILYGYIWAGGIFKRNDTNSYPAYMKGWAYFGEEQGLFFVPMNLTLSDNLIESGGDQSNKNIFMTLTKMGEIKAVFRGLYETDSQDIDWFYGQTVGYWKTDKYFKFASIFGFQTYSYIKVHEGEGGNGTYTYKYIFDDEDAWAEFEVRQGNTVKKRVYERDWGYEEFTYNKESYAFSNYSRSMYPADYPGSFISDYGSILSHMGVHDSIVRRTSNYFLLSGFVSGIMGGVDSLWKDDESTPAKFYILGEFDRPKGKRSVFSSEIVSWNDVTKEKTTLCGDGSFFGFLSGREIGEAIDGLIHSVYLRKYGENTSSAGILLGSFEGEYYDDPKMWMCEGDFYRVELLTGTSFNWKTIGKYLFHHIIRRDLPITDGYIDTEFTLGGAVVGDYFPIFHHLVLKDTSSVYFGVWNLVLGADPNINQSWDGILTLKDPCSLVTIKMEGWISEGSKIEGRAVGAGGSVMETPHTWISVGDIKGSLNTNSTFQMVISGISIETTRFLQMVSHDTPRLKLERLNIPTVEVGSTTLSGSWQSGGSSLSLTMANVRFFRATNSSQNVPKI